MALSSFLSRSVQQRTLRVYDSWDASTTAWQANADQSWLSVTPSGTAGDDLVLTADPAGLLAVNPVDPEIYVCGSIGNIITAL